MTKTGWLRSAAKLRLARLICSRPIGWLVQKLFSNGIPHYDTKILLPSGMPEAAAKILFRLYETAEIRMIKKYLIPSLNTVELGASIGVVGSFVSKRLSENSKYLALEANPGLISVLRENIAFNSGLAKTSVINAAIAYGSENTMFSIGRTSLISKLTNLIQQNEVGSQIFVPTISLSTLCTEHDIKKFQLVCDIEGAEVELFKKESTIFLDCQILIIELHRTTNEDKEVTINDTLEYIKKSTSLKLTDRDGDVYVFARHL